MRFAVMLITFFFSVICLRANELAERNALGSIEGTVTDQKTRQPLPGVNIVVLNNPWGAAGDENGHFLIRNIPVGLYTLKASMIGFQAAVKTEIAVASNRVSMSNFELEAITIQLDKELVVSAQHFGNDASQPVSRFGLSPREIRSSAGSAEDIFRILQAMPGIGHAGAFNANLIVRGGSPDENRTLLDNIEIYNPLHFSHPGTSMGIISIVNPSLLESVNLITGAFPAEYGDKLSSVFEMRLKDGNQNHFNSDYTINLGGFGLLLDGPLPHRGNLIFSARRGFFDYITQMMDRPVSPRYWDLVGKTTWSLSANHQIALVGFYYLDEFINEGAMKNSVHEMVKRYTYIKRDMSGGALGLNWRFLFSKNGYLLTTASITNNGWKTSLGTLMNHRIDGDDVREDEVHIKSHIVYQCSNSLELKAGLFGKSVHSDHYQWYGSDTTRTGFIFPADTVYFQPPNSFKVGAFLQTTLKPIHRLCITAGLRSDYFDLTGEKKYSPRLGLQVHLSEKLRLNAAYGFYYQSPSADKMALHPRNRTLKSSRAVHHIVGMDFLMNEDIKITVEYFNKILDNTLVESDTSRILTNMGSGYAQGIEFFFQKKMTGNLVGSFAYTYATSKRRDGANLPYYDFDYDQRHNLTLIAGYKLSNNWRIGAKFQYASGMSYTPVTGTVLRNGLWYVVEADKNSAHYPDAQRLDIRIDRYFHFSTWTLSTYIDLWNVYNHQDVLYFTYETDHNGTLTKETAYDFPIMPIVGLSAQF